MLSGTILGFICVGALLCASIFLAILDRRSHSKFLSRLALTLFLAAFLGGVVVTLLSGVQPRDEGSNPMGVMKGNGGPSTGEGPAMAGPGQSSGIGMVDPDALKRLQDKVASDPKDVKSRERLGHLYLQQQDYENVFQMAHEALKLDPKSVESRVHMGMTLFAMQQLDQALQQFDQALAIDPKNLEALLFKGIVLFQGKQDMPAARETWQKFMKIARPTDTGWDRVQMFLKMTEGK